jgi:4-amino-4-deoxy-L-arabinose transferase-like glycosyltransferase
MKMLKEMAVKKPSSFIFIMTFLIFAVLQYKPAVLNYTTRFVDFAQYMLSHGVTLFPIADDLQPYPDYTVINTLLVYLVSLPFGRVSILSMGLPFCVAAALMLVFVYKLGALHEKKWGAYGVVFALFTWSFLDGVNSLALDIYPALFTVMCFYLAYAGEIYKQRFRLLLVLASLALGFAFRGPIGLIGPASVVASYYFLSKQWRMLVVFCLLAGLVLATGIALLAWAAYIQGGDAFLREVLIMQGLGRFGSDHSPRYYFYFSTGLLTYGVTVLIALNVILKKGKCFFERSPHPSTNMLLYLSGWLLGVIVLFTIPSSKKARYILSITPAISLLAAYLFVDRSRLFASTRDKLLRFCLNLPMVGLGVLLLAFIYGVYAATPLRPNYLGASVGLIALVAVRPWMVTRFSVHPHREFVIFSFGAAAFLIMDMFFFNSVTYHLELANEPTPKFLPYWFW